MTALTQDRASSQARRTYWPFTLASGFKAYKGGLALGDPSTGKVRPGAQASGLVVLGKFAEQVDAAAGDTPVNVNLGVERDIEFWANDGSITAANLFQFAAVLDDQTVTLASTAPGAAPVYGRIMAVEGGRGVGVERVAPAAGVSFSSVSAPAYVANDSILPASPASGGIYDIPTTSAASTVTLPATAKDGTSLRFVADGTKNGHTVQYRDATGPVNLTTALTASKRHQVDVTFLNGKWTANAYVSP